MLFFTKHLGGILMDLLLNYLQEKYSYTNYQRKVAEYAIKTILSEGSKMLMMGFIFRNDLSHYLFALAIMLCLRCNSGGLHFHTYISCFITSTLYIYFSIRVLPLIKLNSILILITLVVTIIICYFIGPVTSEYRPPLDEESINKYRNRTCLFIFYYTLVAYIIPNSTYIQIGCWIIILHSLQLIVAKILRKEKK